MHEARLRQVEPDRGHQRFGQCQGPLRIRRPQQPVADRVGGDRTQRALTSPGDGGDRRDGGAERPGQGGAQLGQPAGEATGGPGAEEPAIGDEVEFHRVQRGVGQHQAGRRSGCRRTGWLRGRRHGRPRRGRPVSGLARTPGPPRGRPAGSPNARPRYRPASASPRRDSRGGRQLHQPGRHRRGQAFHRRSHQHRRQRVPPDRAQHLRPRAAVQLCRAADAGADPLRVREPGR